MMLGMSLQMLTILHTLISLVAIATGFVVLVGWMSGRDQRSWTQVFLVTTAATSLTGFMFPINGWTPGLVFGVLSMIVLSVVWLARGRRNVYLIGSAVALYLNTFVLVVQSFQKVPALNALAPTGTEAPFGIAQALVLALFVWMVRKALAAFRAPAPIAFRAAA